MKRFLLLTMVIGLALAVQGAWALTLQGQMVYGWQSVWTANNDGNPYWDNRSSDRNPDGTSPGNIGYQSFVAGQSYWGSAGGAADLDVTFYSPGPDWAAIKIEIAGLKDRNKFGVYAVTPVVGFPAEIQLFAGSDSAGDSVLFNPLTQLGTPHFGFYLDGPRGKWYTQASKNPAGQTGNQHFAFFTAPPKVPGLKAYYIAAEDTPFFRSDGITKWSDRDYNDMVVYVANIPDASTWMLFLSGVPAVLMLRRRKA